jgi:hypothetical protein
MPDIGDEARMTTKTMTIERLAQIVSLVCFGLGLALAGYLDGKTGTVRFWVIAIGFWVGAYGFIMRRVVMPRLRRKAATPPR